MDGVKFEFYDIIYHCIRKTILSEDGQSAYILPSIFDDIKFIIRH